MLLLLIYFILRYIKIYGCCRKKQQSRFEIQNNIYTINPVPPQFQDITYGYTVETNNVNSLPHTVST
jgi:hypothetical protein